MDSLDKVGRAITVQAEQCACATALDQSQLVQPEEVVIASSAVCIEKAERTIENPTEFSTVTLIGKLIGYTANNF